MLEITHKWSVLSVFFGTVSGHGMVINDKDTTYTQTIVDPPPFSFSEVEDFRVELCLDLTW